MKKSLVLISITSLLLASCIRIDFSKLTTPTSGETLYKETPYKAKMIDFLSMEDMAYGIFPLDSSLAGKEKALSELKDRGLYYWNRNIEILKEMNELELTETQKSETKMLKQYCLMQIKCYKLMYKAVDEHTRKYDEEIEKQRNAISDFRGKNRENAEFL